MSYLVHHIPCILIAESIDKGVGSHESQYCRYVLLWIVVGFRFSTKHNRTCDCAIDPTYTSTPINLLNDDCLLSIFYLYWLPLLDGVEDHSDHILLGLEWNCKQWWYKLMHVC